MSRFCVIVSIYLEGIWRIMSCIAGAITLTTAFLDSLKYRVLPIKILNSHNCSFRFALDLINEFQTLINFKSTNVSCHNGKLCHKSKQNLCFYIMLQFVILGEADFGSSVNGIFLPDAA